MILVTEDKKTAIDTSLIKTIRVSKTDGKEPYAIIATLRCSENAEELQLGAYPTESEADEIFKALCQHWGGGYYVYETPRSVEEMAEKRSFFG